MTTDIFVTQSFTCDDLNSKYLNCNDAVLNNKNQCLTITNKLWVQIDYGRAQTSCTEILSIPFLLALLEQSKQNKKPEFLQFSSLLSSPE